MFFKNSTPVDDRLDYHDKVDTDSFQTISSFFLKDLTELIGNKELSLDYFESGGIAPGNISYEIEDLFIDRIKSKVKYRLMTTDNITEIKSLCLQKWRGVIVSKNEHDFEAKLEDLTDGGTYEIGRFMNKFVPKEDVELFKLGAIFYWTVGYRTVKSTYRKFSEVRFQRLPILTSNEFDTALDRSKEILDILDENK